MRFPAFYDAQRVGQIYAPRTAEATAAGQALGIAPASADTFRTVLLLVDAQVDFVHTDGALSVAGAVEDTRRTIEWIFRNLPTLTTIIASLDSHLPNQIFSPSWWVNAEGQHPQPFTLISSADVQAGRWRAVYQADWSREYVERLEEQAKKQLMIWTYHTLIGTVGQSITPALYEALAYHSAARQTQLQFITKGTVPETEHYSIFEPEVKMPNQVDGGLNSTLLDDLATYDRIYIAGQAKSHCVLESVASMIRYFEGKPAIIQKIHVLTDAMSSVYSPAVDFEALANEAYARFAEQGLVLTTTTAS